MSQDGHRRRALVVGGAGAIGRACASRLVARGHDVVIADVDEAAALDAVTAVEAVAHVHVDVGSSESVRRGTERAEELLGGLDVAVNLAAIGGPPQRVHEYDDLAWERVIDVNLNGTFRCVRAQLVAMLGAGGGSIVIVSSVGAGTGFAGASAYATSKHALTGLTRSTALEYARDDIRVNAVLPGFVDTAFLRSRRSPEELAGLAAAHPMGRLASVEEVSAVVEFLASPDAAFVTGSCYGVDGGFLAGSAGLLSP